MRYTSLFAVGLIPLLTACASNYWPGNATPNGENVVNDVITARFEKASKTNLGSPEDEREIRKVVLKNDPGASIPEIRWISSTEAIAITERQRPYEQFYCALEKNDRGWRLVTTYLGAVE